LGGLLSDDADAIPSSRGLLDAEGPLMNKLAAKEEALVLTTGSTDKTEAQDQKMFKDCNDRLEEGEK